MIPNLTLFTPEEEKRCVKLFYIGFCFLPILWLINIFTFQSKLNQSMKSFQTYLNIATKTQDYIHVERVLRISKLLLWSKILFATFIFIWICWIVFFQYQTTTPQFFDTWYNYISLMPQPLPNPYD